MTVAFACPAWRSLPRLHLCWVIKAEVVISSKNHPVALEAGQETQIQRETIYETLWALRGQTVPFDLQRVTKWSDRRTKKLELAALLTWCRTVDSEMRFPLTKVLAFSIGMMLTVSCMLDITLKKYIYKENKNYFRWNAKKVAKYLRRATYSLVISILMQVFHLTEQYATVFTPLWGVGLTSAGQQWGRQSTGYRGWSWAWACPP